MSEVQLESKTHFHIESGQPFKLGLIPSSRHKLSASIPFAPKGNALPAFVAYVPSQLAMWGNDSYGDCVSAEEAYNQDVCGKFLSNSTVTNWASRYGFLNGANLDDVMSAMNQHGMSQDGHVYGVGPNPLSVDYSNEPVLKAAIAIGPVKIGIDHSALPSGAGNASGWHAAGGSQKYMSEDHCVSLGGFGSSADLYKALGVALPAGFSGNEQGYLLFTWSTIGFVDHAWIMSTVGEAWLRNPSQMIDGVAQPNPGPVVPPPVPPAPPAPPTPAPAPIDLGLWIGIGVGVIGIAVAIIALLKK